jgi:hypothetical protein
MRQPRGEFAGFFGGVGQRGAGRRVALSKGDSVAVPMSGKQEIDESEEVARLNQPALGTLWLAVSAETVRKQCRLVRRRRYIDPTRFAGLTRTPHRFH